MLFYLFLFIYLFFFFSEKIRLGFLLMTLWLFCLSIYFICVQKLSFSEYPSIWTPNDDDDLVFYILFNSIYVILRLWKGDNDGLCAMKIHTVMSWVLPQRDSNPGLFDPKLGTLTISNPGPSSGPLTVWPYLPQWVLAGAGRTLVSRTGSHCLNCWILFVDCC